MACQGIFKGGGGGKIFEFRKETKISFSIPKNEYYGLILSVKVLYVICINDCGAQAQSRRRSA